jgi:hypothetical protein
MLQLCAREEGAEVLGLGLTFDTKTFLTTFFYFTIFTNFT